MLSVTFDNVSIKDYMRPQETQAEPDLYWPSNRGKLYTVMMYDPDAPNPEFIHWLIVNLRTDTPSGDVLVPYMGPAPPEGTGYHRYYLNVYEQDHMITDSKRYPSRFNFSSNTFVNSNGLRKVAGAMFKARK